MNIRSSSKMALAWLAMAALSAPALAHDPASQHTTKQSASKHRAKAGAMTRAPMKSNGSGVGMQYRVDGTAQVGRAIPVALLFDSVTDPDGATVRLSADAGLTIQGETALTLPAGKSTAATVSVVSEREGLAYLNVFITQNGAMSAVSVPVQTGTTRPVMKPSGDLKQTPDGETLITMPAK